MSHRDLHPTPVEGCFGCHVSTLGFQGLRSRQGVDPVEKVKVIGDDGRRGGKVVGFHKKHWDGRQDVVAMPVPIKIKTKVTSE
jgi:hypothetical protein